MTAIIIPLYRDIPAPLTRAEIDAHDMLIEVQEMRHIRATPIIEGRAASRLRIRYIVAFIAGLAIGQYAVNAINEYAAAQVAAE